MSNPIPPKAQRKNNDLLNQFFSVLETQYENAKATTDAPAIIGNQIEKLLNNGEKTWPTAYKIELSLPFFLAKEQLLVEYKRRLAEAKTILAPATLASYTEQPVTDNEENLRSLLHRLMNDLQWAQQKKYESWKLHSSLLKKLTTTSIGMLILAAISYFAIFWSHQLFPSINSVNFFIPLLSVFLGALGACFALLWRAQQASDTSQMSELERVEKTSYIAGRLLLGALAAYIGFFLLHTEVVTLSFLKGSPLPEHFKLIIVSFLLGFSEIFIPNLLNKTSETQAQ